MTAGEPPCENDRVTFHLVAERPLRDELVELYRSAGWTAYTDDEPRLLAGVRASTFVVTARDEVGTLVGLVRALSDLATITYVQDILVSPEHQRSGVGGALLDELLRLSADFRQVVLLTDDEPGQRAFYEPRGFVEAHENTPSPLRSFVRVL